MESIKQRAIEMLPSVMLTALSMIQALGIELLWSRIREPPYLWMSSLDAVIGWSQIATLRIPLLPDPA